MNIAKNMEAIFFVAIALVSVTSFATASASAPASHTVHASAMAAEGPVQVVTVSARRMTAAEKAAAVQ